jgi:hypothetical protein
MVPGVCRVADDRFIIQLDVALRRKNVHISGVDETDSSSSQDDSSESEDSDVSHSSVSERPRKRQRRQSDDNFGLTVSLNLKSDLPLYYVHCPNCPFPSQFAG